MRETNAPKTSAEETEEARVRAKYHDIIDRQRPEDPDFFVRHPRMSLDNRAKIFAPFAALRGFDQMLDSSATHMLRTQRVVFSEEEQDLLSGKLMQVEKGMEVTVTYFLPDSPGGSQGYYARESGTVIRIDPGSLVLRPPSAGKGKKNPDHSIPLDQIADISGETILNLLAD